MATTPQVQVGSGAPSALSPQAQARLQQIQSNPLLQTIFAPYLQGGFQNLQTQASTANTQAALPGVQATSTVDQQKANQVAFVQSARNQLDAAKNKDGYVDPSVYNKLQSQAGALGMDTSTFDGAFENSYTDPNSPVGYNTATGRANTQAFNEIKRNYQALVNQYNQLPASQKGLLGSYNLAQGGKSLASDVSGLPIVGGALGETVNNLSTGMLKVVAPQAYAYEQARTAFAAQLKSLAGGGAGSGLRVTQTELNNWGNLTPSAANTDAQNQENVNIVDAELKSSFNTKNGLDPQYVTGKSSPSNNGGTNASNFMNVVNPVSNIQTAAQNIQKGGIGGNASTAGNLGASFVNAAQQTGNAIAQVPRLGVTAAEGVGAFMGGDALLNMLKGIPIGGGGSTGGGGIQFGADGAEVFPSDITQTPEGQGQYQSPWVSRTPQTTPTAPTGGGGMSSLVKNLLRYAGYGALVDEFSRGGNQPTNYNQQP